MEDSIYSSIFDLKNLTLAWKKARKGKTKKSYVVEFEKNIAYNLKILHDELKDQTYSPHPPKSFVLRDPKTRKISRSDFRDRVIHHAICNIIEPLFNKSFIYDSCANRKNKGTSFALQRFELFNRKVSKNFSRRCFCLKADIKHYFQEINRNTLIKLIKRKISCDKTLALIKIILDVFKENSGMPLGNLTSQFFANIFLHELDFKIKHSLKAKYYIRYVDDFIIFHKSKKQLCFLKVQIEIFLKEELQLELHPDKSKIIDLSKGVDFVGFRNYCHYKLLRKRNIHSMKGKIESFKDGKITQEKFSEIWQGWNAYSSWANTYKLRESLMNELRWNLKESKNF